MRGYDQTVDYFDKEKVIIVIRVTLLGIFLNY